MFRVLGLYKFACVITSSHSAVEGFITLTDTVLMLKKNLLNKSVSPISSELSTISPFSVQVNLCQKLLLLQQLTNNMTTDCSLNYKLNSWKCQAQTWGEHVVYRHCFWHSEQFLYTTCSPHSAKRRASDKDLPVHIFSWSELTIFRDF